MSLSHKGERAGAAMPETMIGLGLMAVAGIALWQTAEIPVSPMYSKVGPTVFPYLTSGGLALFAALLMLAGARGGWQPDDEKETQVHWYSFACVVAGLFANVLLIKPLGFTAASVVMFTLVCHGFGSRRPLRDALIGLVLSLTVYFGFAQALGVNIGAGLIEAPITGLITYLIGG